MRNSNRPGNNNKKFDSTSRNPASVGPPLITKPGSEAKAALTSLTLTGDTDCDSDTSKESDEHPTSPHGGERPHNWTTGLYSSLEKLVVKAKGTASKPVVNYIKKHLSRTKLIFVVSQSGTGKSTFLHEISGMDLHIGKTRNSGTKNYQVCPAIIGGEQYLFIDTPGFGAADMDDMDCFCDIIACLDVLGPFVTVAGLIFVTSGNQERLTAQELKTIQWIKCFCGPEFYRYITIMTSKWDKISEDDFEETWESMLSMLEDNPSVAEIFDHPTTSKHNSNQYQGGHVYHHGIVVDEGHPNVPLTRLSVRRHGKQRAEMAITMIMNRYKMAPGVKLQVIREMGKNILWHDTEAAKVLRHNPKDIKLYFRDGILQVFVRSEGRRLADESGLGAPQPAASRQHPADELPCAEVAKVETQYYRSASDYKPNDPQEQHQSWVDKVWTWLGIAKDAALFFLSGGFW
ncbi:P-loop containing nucleoside triphosphate hydrolase protein [Xylaria scruposa]|nr:P-loop containing nucleoside triphosphate hydrolase protein [Xylaria scruposa]